MYTHVGRWRTLYKRLIGRDFEPDDYLFPFVSSNGTIHAKRAMTHDAVQDLINEFALAAEINKIFTTHCLRRGGSQFRFMFAPLGQRWSLSIIRWWGGWAEGEQVDTLMRYLLDSLQSYESGHGDALYPFRNEPAKSFMGDSNALQRVYTRHGSTTHGNCDTPRRRCDTCVAHEFKYDTAPHSAQCVVPDISPPLSLHHHHPATTPPLPPARERTSMPAHPSDDEQNPIAPAEGHRDNAGSISSQACQAAPRGDSPTPRTDTSFERRGVEETTVAVFMGQLQRTIAVSRTAVETADADSAPSQ
ncbi:hypothetical protein C8R46DRAFT_1314001 [Mycena filopes]|nr:hypothetical protein C8R46DRAFT_1314001 [Mycena filopes]